MEVFCRPLHIWRGARETTPSECSNDGSVQREAVIDKVRLDYVSRIYEDTTNNLLLC